jgi:hypothetical protein
MLAGVLLHVVKPPTPFDLAPNACPSKGSCKEVSNPLAFVHHIGDLDSVQLTDIEWLATGGGVEGCLVEVDPAGIVGPVYDRRLEVAEV